jgi:hypothetical protein
MWANTFLHTYKNVAAASIRPAVSMLIIFNEVCCWGRSRISLHTMRIGHEDDGIFDNSDEFVSEYDLAEHVSQLT